MINRCYCGNKPPSTQYLDSDDVHCTFSCAGDPNDRCGGQGGYLSVFYDPTKYTPGSETTTPTGGPATVNTTGNYNYIGCYSEATNGRALSGNAPPAPTNGFTIELCEAACQGYTYFEWNMPMNATAVTQSTPVLSTRLAQIRL